MNIKKLNETLEKILNEDRLTTSIELEQDMRDFKQYMLDSYEDHPGLTKERLNAIDVVIDLLDELNN